MDIRPTPWLAPNAEAPAPAGPAIQPQAWLRELEHARWQAQPRHTAASPAQATASQASRAMPQAGHGPAQTQAMSPEPQQLRGPQAGDGPTVLSREGLARPLPATAALPAASQPLALPLAAQAFVAGELHRRRQRPNAPAVPEPAQRRADGDWARRNVHVHLGAEDISVWVRDAGLDAEAARALLDHLALLHGDVGADRQVRLTVNGQAVSTAAHGPQQNSFYRGEHRGD